MMKFGIRHIRHFIAVAEELHFRRAAERLNIAQPALSRSIKHLEGQVGVHLLERDNRNVSLTTAGEVFLAGSRRLVDSMEGVVAQARKASIGEAGHLIVGYTDFAISGSLPRILKEFRTLYPDITVEPVHGFTGPQLSNLETEKLDFGFVTGPFDRPGYAGVTVQRDPYVAILHESHPLSARKTVRLAELAEEPFILGSPMEWQHYHDHLLRICRGAGFVPKTVQQAFNLEGIFGLIACEMGVTVQPACTNNCLRKGLIVVPISDVKVTLPTMAVWKKSGLPPARETFVKFLLNQDVRLNRPKAAPTRSSKESRRQSG